MNILAEMQKSIFEEGITPGEKAKIEKEFLKKYKELRDADEQKLTGKLSIEQRRKIHWLILSVYKIENAKHGLTYEVLKDERTKTDRPIIFAVTHVGKFDIQVISQAIKDHYYLLSGDYEHLQGTMDGSFLNLLGTIYFNENDTEDRKAVTGKMINHLQAGGTLMYFPEGTWNMTENLPMLPCYWGIVNIAKQGNAIIVPIAADQYDNHFVINIGKNFDMSKFPDTVEGKTEAINSLRDTLSTLKYEIWENRPIQLRDELDKEEWNEYKKARYSEWPYFNDEYIKDLVYHPKDVVDSQEVYEPVRKLSPKKENAFLFNKRNKG